METIIKAKIFTGKKEFCVLFDKANDLLIVNATEDPQKGKANKEIVKGLKKILKAETIILSGLKSREKTLLIKLPREQIETKVKEANSKEL